MGDPLRALIVEDSERDAELLAIELRRGGYEVSYLRVFTEETMRRALDADWDVVLSDYSMPQFSGVAALRVLRESGRDLPFIIVSGTIGEETAVHALKEGAHDFLLKDRLARLLPAIARELREARLRRERLEANAERERLLAELANAVAARDEFLAIASHELNTPLTSLKLHVWRILNRFGDLESGPEALGVLKQQFQVIARQGDRLERLVRELLDVSRITGGGLRLDLEAVDLAGVIRDVAQRLTDTAVLAHAGCRLTVDAAEQVVGRWDAMRVEQIVDNLLQNALKYGAGKPVTVRATTDGATATLTVEDHGIGLSPADRGRIFGRFERAVSSRNYGGLGMGLFIVKQVVEAHAGSVDVQSQPGDGATFVVRLPIAGPPERVSG
jgi:signal transduction histidine kinase